MFSELVHLLCELRDQCLVAFRVLLPLRQLLLPASELFLLPSQDIHLALCGLGARGGIRVVAQLIHSLLEQLQFAVVGLHLRFQLFHFPLELVGLARGFNGTGDQRGIGDAVGAAAAPEPQVVAGHALARGLDRVDVVDRAPHVHLIVGAANQREAVAVLLAVQVKCPVRASARFVIAGSAPSCKSP